MNSIDEAIESVREQNRRILEDRLTNAARKDLDNTRAAIRALVPCDCPEYIVLDTIASSLTIGRKEDGFPDRKIPDDIEKSYVRMVRALGHVGYFVKPEDRTGFLTLLGGFDSRNAPYVTFDRITQDEHREHYVAWEALNRFSQYNS